MMGFLEWVEFNRKKKEREKKDVRSVSKSGQENRSINHKGETNRYDQEVPEPIVYRFTEPK